MHKLNHQIAEVANRDSTLYLRLSQHMNHVITFCRGLTMNNLKHLWILLGFLVPLGNNAQAQFDPFITQPQMPPPINAPAMSIEQQMRDRMDGQRVTPRSNSRINPRLASAYLKVGFQHYKQGQYQNAIAAYNLALSNNPSYAAAYLGRSMALRRIGDKYNALLDARRAAHWSRQQGNMTVYNAAEKFKRAIYRE
jgi:tetratricopeptide (TPR) repeat protein